MVSATSAALSVVPTLADSGMDVDPCEDQDTGETALWMGWDMLLRKVGMRGSLFWIDTGKADSIRDILGESVFPTCVFSSWCRATFKEELEPRFGHDWFCAKQGESPVSSRGGQSHSI